MYLLIPVDAIEQVLVTRRNLIYSSWIHLNFPNLLTVLRLKMSYIKFDDKVIDWKLSLNCSPFRFKLITDSVLVQAKFEYVIFFPEKIIVCKEIVRVQDIAN